MKWSNICVTRTVAFFEMLHVNKMISREIHDNADAKKHHQSPSPNTVDYPFKSYADKSSQATMVMQIVAYLSNLQNIQTIYMR